MKGNEKFVSSTALPGGGVEIASVGVCFDLVEGTRTNVIRGESTIVVVRIA